MAKKTRTTDNPQIKDQELYSELTEQGMSKEKSARIANAAARDGRQTVGKRGGESPAYEDWLLKDLQARAKEIGLSGYSKLRKHEIIDRLRHH